MLAAAPKGPSSERRELESVGVVHAQTVFINDRFNLTGVFVFVIFVRIFI